MTRTLLSTTAALAAATALIVVSTVMEGLSNGCWSRGAAQTRPTPMSVKMPATVGDWEREEGPTRIDARPETVEWIFHRQRPERTARVCLVAGDRRTLAGHGPQSCYPNTSLRLEGSPAEHRIEAGKVQAEFWTSGFWKEEASGRRRIRAMWSCRAGGSWTAAGSGPAGAPAVTLYLFIEEPLAESAEGERLLDLARAIMPGLEESLAPGVPPATDDEPPTTN